MAKLFCACSVKCSLVEISVLRQQPAVNNRINRFFERCRWHRTCSYTNWGMWQRCESSFLTDVKWWNADAQIPKHLISALDAFSNLGHEVFSYHLSDALFSQPKVSLRKVDNRADIHPHHRDVLFQLLLRWLSVSKSFHFKSVFLKIFLYLTYFLMFVCCCFFRSIHWKIRVFFLLIVLIALLIGPHTDQRSNSLEQIVVSSDQWPIDWSSHTSLGSICYSLFLVIRSVIRWMWLFFYIVMKVLQSIWLAHRCSQI